MKLIKMSHGFLAKVSDKDYTRVLNASSGTWWPVRNRTTVYAYTKIKGKDIPMHVFITGHKVDHRDHDGLNNQRSNLRRCSQSQNLMNMSKTSSRTHSRYKGVSWKGGRANKWCAYIKQNGKTQHLGLFTKEVDAAKAYDEAAIRLFGQFANLNFRRAK